MAEFAAIEDKMLDLARRANRIWFYRPEMYWHGWATLLPTRWGHDECARRTLVLGWTITGRVVIPLKDCGEQTCKTDAYLTVCSLLESDPVPASPHQKETCT